MKWRFEIEQSDRSVEIFWQNMMYNKVPVRVAIADWNKIVKVWSVVVSVAGAAAGVVVAARVEVAVVDQG